MAVREFVEYNKDDGEKTTVADKIKAVMAELLAAIR